MTPKQRTLLAVGLFIPLAAILLVTIACLPAPVGDPEQSKVDDKLTGAWQGVSADPTDKTIPIVLLRPWDAHSYYLQYLYMESKDGTEKASILNFKAWLTPLAGATFITCEPLDNSNYLGGTPRDGDQYYWVAKLERKDDTMTVSPISESSDLVKDLKTRETIEAAIKAHVNDKALYATEGLTFKKLDKDHLQIVDDIRKKANVGMR